MKWKLRLLFLFTIFLHLSIFNNWVLAVESSGSVTLTVNFPDLSSVHTDVRVTDGITGSIADNIVARANWKSNKAQLNVPPGVYDVRVRKGTATYIIDDVDCRGSSCNVDNITSVLTVSFPELSSVHTDVWLPGADIGAEGVNEVTHSNWKTNWAKITVLRGIYDVRIRKGASSIVVDSINCQLAECSVKDIVATLSVNFPGLSGVHSYVWLPDGVKDTVSNEEVTKSKWKTDSTQISVLRGKYDVRIHKGESSLVIDDVDCNQANCSINEIVAKMTVNFPGISSVHTDVWLPDSMLGAIGAAQVTKKNWKSNLAELAVLRGKYDVRVRKGESSLIIDDVDCRQNACNVKDIVSTLTVDFPGISSAHTDVWIPDNTPNQISDQEVTHSKWKKNQAVLTVLRGEYDVRVRKGSAALIVDKVDCNLAACKVSDIIATLTVNFPEMSSVHTDVWLPGANIGAEDVEKVTHSNWKTDSAELTILRGIYDVRVRKGPSAMLINNVNCQSSSCSVDDIVSTLTVNFPDMTGVHTDVWLPDTPIDSENSEKVTHNNWKKDNAVLTVLRGVYDVRVQKGSSALVVDSVDCRNNSCTVNDIVSTMTVNFLGLSSVHTDVWLPDEQPGAVSDNSVTKNNWKSNQAQLAVLRMNYDVRVRKGDSEIVIDNVDCKSGDCVINDIVATLNVRFPGLSSVHSDARIPDDIAGSATGSEVNHANWKKHETSIIVLRKHYDVRVRHEVTTIFDNVDCTSGACDVLVLGNSQVTLIDGDNNVIIPNKPLTAYEKLSDGTLVKTMKGVTNNEGKVHFTLNGIDMGKVYVIKAGNPLNNRKNYYSPFISEAGELLFVVTADSDTELDLTPPSIGITSPLDGKYVSHNGFQIRGFATDNQQMDSVVITLDNGSTSTDIPASLESGSNSWSAQVTSDFLTADQTVTITATATDRVRNTASVSITVTPIVDILGPTITITSHLQQDTVPATGFLLSGVVSDQTYVQSLVATLVDPGLGIVFQDLPVEYSSTSGNWTVAVQNGQISENSMLNLTLSASDSNNNQSSTDINLNVVAVDNTGAHMVRRLTFGPTPMLMQQVDTLGAQNFLNQQLSPNSINDSELNARINGFTPTSLEELQSWSLLRMIYSKRQLLEVMTWFWDNHFNTNIESERKNANNVEVSNTVAFELSENNAFRANALGNFRQLLEISAKSPSMLIYLDSISNVADDSNENYARELLELHTMGVDGGYSHHDIEASSEIFTGWHLQNGAFFFNDSQHNFQSHTVLGVTIPAGGVEQGEQLLDIVAAHSSTAKFICSKLAIVFVSDNPPQSLVDRCATLFKSTVNAQDQITQVLALILSSPEFFDPAYDRSKIKTPLEFVVGTIRSLEAETNATDLAAAIENMGIRLYQNDIPTGWSETGDDWINPSLLIERIKWTNQFVRAEQSANTYSDLMSFFPSYGFETTDGIVGFLLELLLGNGYTELARQQATSLLNGVNGFDLSDPDAEARLQQLTGAILGYPHYQFQ